MTEFNSGDRVVITDYPEADIAGKLGTVEAFDMPHTLIRVDGFGYTQRFYSHEFERAPEPKDNTAIDAVGQDFLDRLEAAVASGLVNDDLWRLGFISALINEVDEALS